MRVLVLFDLPTLTSSDRKEYRKFRKYLVKQGFIQLQESIYVKLALNGTASKYVINDVRRNKPLSGSVMVLKVTENQFVHMELIVGEFKSDIVCSTESVVVL